jgi:septum formation protein
MPPLILASQSPRRRELLVEAGYDFTVLPPAESAESPPSDRLAPPELVAVLACQKAADVAARVPAGLVLGCDTVAECGGRILGKPADRDDARAMFRLLRGREHTVYSGLCLWQRPEDRVRVAVEVTHLVMDNLGDAEIEGYLDTGQWQGKAGGFGYQDRLGWIHVRAGSESNVVGLPLELLARLLET